MSEIRKTVKFSIIYAIGELFNKAVGFIMLPIYTRYLKPGDYGILELLSMTIDVVALIIGMGLFHAVFRFYTKYEEVEDKKEVMSTAFIMLFILSLIGFLLIFAFSSPLAKMLFGSSADYTLYLQIFAVTLLFEASVRVPMMYMQAIQKPHVFVTVNFFKLLIQLSLNIYLVVFLKMKVLGILYGTLLSGIMVSLYLVPRLIRDVGLRYSKQKAIAMFRFGLPLVFSGFASFYLQFSDRYFIRLYSDLENVGLYSLAYKFGFLLIMVAYVPFSRTWDVQRFEILKTEGAKETYQRIFLIINFVLIGLGLILSLGSKDLLRLMSSPEFESAHTMVPIIVLAFIVQSWTNYISLGIFISEKTSIMTVANFIACITVTAFCILLIPRLGAIGAAYATLISFIVRFIWIKYKAYQLYSMGLVWKKPLLSLALAGGILLISNLVTQEDIRLSVAFNTGLIGVFIAITFLTPLLPSDIKLQIIRASRNSVSGLKVLRQGIELSKKPFQR